jgi:outer membrane protein insertion porin family
MRVAFILLLLATGLMAQTFRSVSVVGNSRIDSEAILFQVKKPPLAEVDVSEAIRAIYRTGFFDTVVAERKGDVLIFNVTEKPLVRKIFVEGNKEISTSDLTPVFSFGSNRFLDRFKIDTLRKNGVTFYQQKGFYDAKVTASVVPVGDNQVDVTFKVTEGDRMKLRTIEFRGLNRIDADDLKAVMQTKEYSWWKSWATGSGRVNKKLLEADQAILRQYLLDNGYVEGSVSDGIIEKRDDGLALVFYVTEGEQFKVGKVIATGDSLAKGDPLEGIELVEGEIFNASKLRSDSFVIAEKFADEGFAFANVVPNTQINSSLKTVDLNYTVSKGKPVTVNRIDISGNKKTYDNVIRREMQIQETEQFSGSKVRRSKELLTRTGYFNDVTISPESVAGADDKANLNVVVQEGQTGTFSAGVGYSSADGLLFNARVTESNLFGQGRSIDLNADIGTEANNFLARLRDRRFMDGYWALGLEGYQTTRRFDDFDRHTVGGGFSAGYPLERVFGETLEDIDFAIRYDFARVEIANVKDEAAPLIKDSQGKANSSSVTPTLTRNTINNPLNPTNGSQQVLSYEFAGLGGDYKFGLFTARNVLYHPLFKLGNGSLVFSNRTRFDYGIAPDKYGEGEDFFPLFKRFFPGGINSVRGYESRSMGPKVGDSEYGGNKQFVNNTELIFPLAESAGIRGIVFFDIGEAFDDSQSMDFGALRKAYGTGIRWSSPLGPIRLEFGFPMDRQEGDSNMQTMFTFGAPF